MKYQVQKNNRVKYNGTVYEAGEEVPASMDKETAEALVEDGVLKRAKKLENCIKKELRKMAKEAGIEFNTKTTKKELIKALK